MLIAKIIKYLVLFHSLFITMSGVANNNLAQKIQIVFRYDDYQLTSTKFYDSLFYVFQKNQYSVMLRNSPFR